MGRIPWTFESGFEGRSYSTKRRGIKSLFIIIGVGPETFLGGLVNRCANVESFLFLMQQNRESKEKLGRKNHGMGRTNRWAEKTMAEAGQTGMDDRITGPAEADTGVSHPSQLRYD